MSLMPDQWLTVTFYQIIYENSVWNMLMNKL